MTSANFSRPSPTPRPTRGTSRRGARAAVTAAALAGALTLAACSGGGDSDGSSSATPSVTSGSDTGGASGGTSGSSAPVTASGELEGSWLTTADGRAVALIITGEQAALFATGGTVCSGTAGKEADMTMIRLTCASGKKDRTTGMVDSADGKSLRITWDGAAGKETYTKAEGGQWPSGLPTAGPG
ncbi:hypothetical protein BM536_033395 [Streptomyces phaeoluteigriseus]|uniref:Uncharacterized protein n=1 Tax=Streptomyces phaeoluteigriseus TaxID=114686 RepID=A0A1V6MKN4_9ACTN|nr:hypothetical protein [Streptomyces phaeoluteigriseus]OQD52948.1 hypothetical protein BM536_033395 [Streptomyces phaeoluteigriseus]